MKETCFGDALKQNGGNDGKFLEDGLNFEMGEIGKEKNNSFIEDNVIKNGEEQKLNDNKDDVELIIEKEGLIDALKGIDFSGLGIDLFTDTYEGLNSIRDTLYVEDASKDWKGTTEELRNNRKEKIEHSKKVFVKDQGNKEFIIKEMNLMGKFREQYPEKTESYIKNLAEEKAEKELTKIADSYIPLGLKDVNLAYQLSEDQKQYGYKPQEAIKQRIEFDRFDKNPENIGYINQNYNVQCNTVSEVIPNAREYYNNGYGNVKEMKWVDDIANKLNKTPQYAIKIDKVLRSKNGKINYNGEDEELKKVVEQINRHYGK